MKDLKRLYLNIGKKIRNYRKDKKLTLEDLADKINMDWSFISRIETGKAVASIETLFKISQALNIKLELLFKDVDTSTEEILDREFSDKIKDLSKKEKDKFISILKSILEKTDTEWGG